MCGPAALPIAMVVGGALAAGASIYSANKAANAQKQATQAAAQQAQTQAAADKAANDRLINSQNRKQADFGAFNQQNLMATLGGAGSTMLTGPSGSSPTSSMLGATTLLGH